MFMFIDEYLEKLSEEERTIVEKKMVELLFDDDMFAIDDWCDEKGIDTVSVEGRSAFIAWADQYME